MVKFSSILIVPTDFGHNFLISGKTLFGANRITIDFKDQTNQNTIVFHMSIRFVEDRIVRNSRDYDFGEEERSRGATGVGNPFTAGDYFRLSIFVENEGFSLYTNDDYYCHFRHRINPQTVSVIAINGDLDHIRQMDHRRVSPYFHPLVQNSQLTPYNFSGDIPVLPIPGLVVIIKAMIIGQVTSSVIFRFFDTIVGREALHFDIGFSRQYVARNNACNATGAIDYNEQETYGGFPFDLNQIFKIAFGLGERSFRIAINGRHFCEYIYRTKLENIGGFKASAFDGLVLKVLQFDNLISDSMLGNLDVLSII